MGSKIILFLNYFLFLLFLSQYFPNFLLFLASFYLFINKISFTLHLDEGIFHKKNHKYQALFNLNFFIHFFE
jgi:hypothetical protein